MKRYLMVFGVAYALGVGTVLLVGHNPSSLPVCENQSQRSDLNPSDDGSSDEKIFHLLEADPFQITSGETESHKEVPICRGMVETVLPGFDKIELGAIMMGLINKKRKSPAPGECLEGPEEFGVGTEFYYGAGIQRYQDEHRLTLLNDLTP